MKSNPEKTALRAHDLSFSYENGPTVLNALSFCVPHAARTLLVGANGVGKSTLLQLLAGHHLLSPTCLEVFGSSPFFDMSLSSRISLVDGVFPITVDLTVRELLEHPTPGVEIALQNELLNLLEVDLSWRMCRVSEGQRRRVQLLLALRKNCDLLLLDEVTSHLDIVVRSDLLAWLKNRNEEAGTTILYTTHILDGLQESQWPTHIAFMKLHQPMDLRPLEHISELKSTSLHSWVETRIRQA